MGYKKLRLIWGTKNYKF